MTGGSTAEPEQIRRHYDELSKTWYFSVVDVIALVTESSDPRNYWKVLKRRLYKSNPELVTQCNQLKLPSSDGKNYLTDTAESSVLLEIVSSISPLQTKQIQILLEKIESTYPQGTIFSDADTASLLVTMYETPTDIVIESFVAGTAPESLTLSVNYARVSIAGERINTYKESHCVTQEVYWGKFFRTIELPAHIYIDSAQATLTRGFLQLRMQKIETDRVRIVKIKSPL